MTDKHKIDPKDPSDEVILDTDGYNKQLSPKTKWCFTYNNYTKDELNNIISSISSKCYRYIIGEEVAPTTGTPHLQGFIIFKTKNRPSCLKLTKKIHWEACKGTIEQNIKYCSKDGLFHTNFKVPKPITTLDENKLYLWQSEILDIIKLKPHERQIIWIYEYNGSVGKSAFCKFLALKYGGLMVDGKGSDIMKAIHGYKEEHKDFPDIIMVDVPRDSFNYFNYAAIEKVKNGHVFCGKYESQQLIFNNPHVLVFCNEPPDLTKWSKDRYYIREINSNDLEIKNDNSKLLKISFE